MENRMKKDERTIIQLVRFNSEMSGEEITKVAGERREEFDTVPGLLQNYYAKTDLTGEYVGVYIWESMEALNAFRASNMAASIPHSFKINSIPNVELLDVLFQLKG